MRVADANGVIIIDGDSISTAQLGAPAFIDLVMSMLCNPPNLSVHMTAVPGRTMQIAVSDFANGVVPYKSNGPVNVVIAATDLDGILSGASVEQEYATMRQYADLCHQNGFRFITGTCAPRTWVSIPAWFETQRLAFNDMIRSTWQNFADGCIDFGGDPVIGNVKETYGTVFYADQMHWTTAGAMRAAGIAYPVIKAELAAFGFENKAVDSGVWQPVLTDWTASGTPFVEGVWSKSNGIVHVCVKITPGTNISSLAGTSFVGPLPFTPLIDGSLAGATDENQGLYFGGGAVKNNVLWPPTIATTTHRIVVSATYITGE